MPLAMELDAKNVLYLETESGEQIFVRLTPKYSDRARIAIFAPQSVVIRRCGPRDLPARPEPGGPRTRS